MRAASLLGVACFFVFAIVARQAGAQPIVSFDENGNGTVNGVVLPFTVELDPTTVPGTMPPTLMYTLPFIPSVSGDVQIFESPTGGPASDLLRFVPGSPQLFVYSDLAESGEKPDLADVGLPPNAQTNITTRVEQGPEGGVNGLFPYIPTPNEPGFVVGANAQYNFTSDVPEPVAAMVLCAGWMLISLRRQRA